MSAPAGIGRCWEERGVAGDRSCPTLAEVIHCRNCEAYVAAGRQLLDRAPPAGYREEWTGTLAREVQLAPRDELHLMVFRLGGEWLALETKLLKRVAEPRPRHRVPHRGGLLAGLVNIEGEIHLLVRLELLLGIEHHADDRSPGEATAAPEREPAARMMMIELRGGTWVFRADEVLQLAHVSASTLGSPPATLSAASSGHTRGTFFLQGREVALLDEELLGRDLETRLGRLPRTPLAKEQA